MSSTWHPNTDDIIEAHDYAGFVSRIRTSGFRKSVKWGIGTLKEIIEEARDQGDVYRSAAVYLKEIIRKHPFSDGNHRTAYITALRFLRKNGEPFVADEVLDTGRLTDALKNEVKFKSIEENANWIKTGDFHGNK